MLGAKPECFLLGLLHITAPEPGTPGAKGSLVRNGTQKVLLDLSACERGESSERHPRWAGCCLHEDREPGSGGQAGLGWSVSPQRNPTVPTAGAQFLEAAEEGARGLDLGPASSMGGGRGRKTGLSSDSGVGETPGLFQGRGLPPRRGALRWFGGGGSHQIHVPLCWA